MHTSMYVCMKCNPFPQIKKSPPPQIINPHEVLIIRGSFLANVLKTKFFKPIKHPQKPSKLNDNPNSDNNFLSYFI